MKKSIGILGGMGPLATADLFQKIVLLTDAEKDNDHIRIFIDNNSAIPDRTAAILNGGADPVPEMKKALRSLERCGADCRNIAFINEEVCGGLTLDDERIRQAIISFRPRLVVIDPIQAYLGNDSDLLIAGRARKLMQRLGMWASVYDCAVVLIGHLNKKEGSKDLYRSLGSIDVVAAARSVLQVERNTADTDIRIVHQIKNSLAPAGNDIEFEIYFKNEEE